jgi:hypothetical protein
VRIMFNGAGFDHCLFVCASTSFSTISRNPSEK